MPTRDRPLRVHVQENANGLDVFVVNEARLAPALAAVPGLAERVSVTYGADNAALDAGLADAEVLFAGAFQARDLASRAPKLKWVQSIFAGVERLLPHIPEHVALTNASGVHAPKAGEFTIAALLMLNSRFLDMQAAQRRREWCNIFTPVIEGKKLVILGTGAIGGAVAAHARHFGMRVTGVSRSGRPAEHFDEVVPVASLAEALDGADFLVCTLPNTPETVHLVNAEVLAGLKRGAGFVSIGRGEVVDESALIEALNSGQIGGAVLDVFETEPLPPESPFWHMDNVLVCAHCGVDDLDAYLPRAIEIFVDNLQRYLDGKPLRNLVNRQLGY